MLKYHIQTIEVGSGGTDSIDFTNISQEYDDLYITLSHRLSGSSNGQQLVLRFNGSATGYYRRLVYSYYESSTGDYSGGSNETHSRFAFVQHSGTTANSFGNASLYIFDYTSSGAKSFGAEAVVASNSDTYASSSYVNYWSGTSPITSVSLSSLLDGASFAPYSSASLYGIKHGTSGEVEVASGGTISYSGGYTIHTFNSSGTFVANRDMDVDYLIVAGGGGSGASGAGAGGLRCTVGATGGGGAVEPKLRVSKGESYSVIVGAGGTGSPNGQIENGSNGSSSSFGQILSVGGAGGTGSYNPQLNVGLSGGSGSGGFAGGDGSNNGSVALGGSGTANQGYAGGNSAVKVSNTSSTGAGGGAGAVGGTPSGYDQTANGGDGVTTNISGSSVAYAGGGGNAIYVSGTSASGGAGGGGNGSTGSSAGSSGSANTGGGAGGAYSEAYKTAAYSGGSGVVIIRYLTP